MPTMMASTTACSPSPIDRLRGWLAVLLLAWASFAWAAEIEIANPQLVPGEDGYVLNADFSFDFNARLEEAVTRGVVLPFVVDFELTRPRWYWFDEKAVVRSKTYRLSYHALTRQYRLSSGGGLHQSYESLTEALRVISRVREWAVVERGAVQPGETYVAALRMRLDLTQLPRPFQIAALGNREWSLASDWKTWPVTFTAEAK
jgi:hypothetical protein